MKKIITLLFTTAIAITVMISCKKNDATPTIVGKWNATKEFSADYINGVQQTADTTIYDANLKFSINFSSNNTGMYSITEEGLNETEHFTYKTAGNQLTFYFDNDTTHGTFSVNHNELVLHSGEEKEIEQGKYKWEDKIFLTRQ